MKRFLILSLLLCLLIAGAAAESAGVTMTVVNCEEWVSLRAEPDTSASRLAKVPLGAEVTGCIDAGSGFIACEYQGKRGYILAKYLTAEDRAAPLTGEISRAVLSMDEMMQDGSEVLRQTVDGHTLLAVRRNHDDELLDVGSFTGSGAMRWGLRAAVSGATELSCTDAFLAGMDTTPCLIVFNAASVLAAYDLNDGHELWQLPVAQLPVGAGLVHALAADGTLYLISHDRSVLCAVSADGQLLWAAEQPGTDVYWPYRIEQYENALVVHYDSGSEARHHVVAYSHDGVMLWSARWPREEH